MWPWTALAMRRQSAGIVQRDARACAARATPQRSVPRALRTTPTTPIAKRLPAPLRRIAPATPLL